MDCTKFLAHEDWMSSARERAEARRARILKSEGSRMAMAKGELSNEDEALLSIPKERPLAARRQKIEEAAAQAPSESQVETVDASTAADNVGIAQNVASESTVVETKARKTLKEIEEEVARSTAEFDAQVLSGTVKHEQPASGSPAPDLSPAGSSSSTSIEADKDLTATESSSQSSATEVKPGAAADTGAVDASKTAAKSVPRRRGLQTSDIMRLLRVLLIVMWFIIMFIVIMLFIMLTTNHRYHAQ